jgi:hypothetical protein
MEIKSMQAYKEACHIVPKVELPPELQTRKDVLDKELAILYKQLEYLNHDLDRMVVMDENPGVIQNKQLQIDQVKAKVGEKEQQINVLYVAPYAEAVWDEGLAYLGHLKCQIQDGYSKAYTLKEQYLQALAEIEQLRKESVNVAAEVSSVRLNMLPPRNPMQPIGLSNTSSFVVSQSDVNKILG